MVSGYGGITGICGMNRGAGKGVINKGENEGVFGNWFIVF